MKKLIIILTLSFAFLTNKANVFRFNLVAGECYDQCYCFMYCDVPVMYYQLALGDTINFYNIGNASKFELKVNGTITYFQTIPSGGLITSFKANNSSDTLLYLCRNTNFTYSIFKLYYIGFGTPPPILPYDPTISYNIPISNNGKNDTSYVTLNYGDTLYFLNKLKHQSNFKYFNGISLTNKTYVQPKGLISMYLANDTSIKYIYIQRDSSVTFPLKVVKLNYNLPTKIINQTDDKDIYYSVPENAIINRNNGKIETIDIYTMVGANIMKIKNCESKVLLNELDPGIYVANIKTRDNFYRIKFSKN